MSNRAWLSLLFLAVSACTTKMEGPLMLDAEAPPIDSGLHAAIDAGSTHDAAAGPDAEPGPDVLIALDASAPRDAGIETDAAPLVDAGTAGDDAAVLSDAGLAPDALASPDAGLAPDALASPDAAASPDAGPDPCVGVGCSGHGQCVAIGGNPTCSCDPGFQPSGTQCTPVMAGTLNIPQAHPRLFFDGPRLSAAQAWFAQHPYTPHASIGDPNAALEAAAHGLITGNAASCRSAIAWAMAVQFSCPGVSCDPARWDGEGAIVTFDWCYDHFTPSERATFTTRWNTYTADLNAKPWGGIGMEGNNYYLGYLRNTLEWAIASYHENSEAPGFLSYGLVTRWEQSLRPYYDGAAKGGQPHEGSAYGRRVFEYLTIPFTAVTQLGRDLWDETPYFKESVFWIIYSTTPGPTTMDNGEVVYETFPFNEDERWSERDPAFNTAQSTLGSYLAPLRGHWAGTPIAGYIQRFLELTGHAIDDRWAEYAWNPTSVPVVAQDFSALPLDYYASGLGSLYAKTSWNADATLYTVQASTPVAVGHEHLDAGSFQLWRSGRFLTRETVGYAQDIAGYAGNGTVDCGSAVGHNGILFNGIGPIGYHHHRPTTLRLDSQADFSYIAFDLTGAYEVADDWAHREDEVGNPSAGTIVRELLFIRPLEALVVFDRLSSEGASPASAVKTFVTHFPSAPTAVDAHTYQATIGGQTLRLSTLLPATTTRRVVTEGNTIGQFRAEIETSGAVESSFLHVLHARGSADPDLSLNLSTSGTTHTLTLSHPTRGSAVVRFEAGLSSVGGSFGYAASGPPSPQPLRSDVRPLVVTTAGPAWGN